MLIQINLMKRLSLYVFLVLMFLSINNLKANELFGIRLGDNIDNYKIIDKSTDNSVRIDPPLPNENFWRYLIYFLDDGTIYMIIAANKEKFDNLTNCLSEMKIYFEIVEERLNKIATQHHKWDKQKNPLLMILYKKKNSIDDFIYTFSVLCPNNEGNMILEDFKLNVKSKKEQKDKLDKTGLQ